MFLKNRKLITCVNTDSGKNQFHILYGKRIIPHIDMNLSFFELVERMILISGMKYRVTKQYVRIEFRSKKTFKRFVKIVEDQIGEKFREKDIKHALSDIRNR